MNDNFTLNYPNNVWCINEHEPNMAIKNSYGTIIKVPLTKEILEEQKKQIKANSIFEEINQKISLNNEHIIGYIYLIIDDYLNYLYPTNLNKLINIMKQLEEKKHINEENTNYIKQLRINLEKRLSSNITEEELNQFYDIFDSFENYNYEYFMNSFSKETSTLKH